MKQYQKIHSRILEMLIEQSSVHEEGKRTSYIEDSLRTMARN